MSFIDKAKNKAEEVAGKAKEAIGDKTNNDGLTREGQADQAGAGVKQTGEKIKDTFGRS
jgi:uncharacterized protein YjbJ (UPF0337 family)